MPYRGLFLELFAAVCIVVAVAFAVNAWLTILAGRGQLLQLVEENLSFRARSVLEEVERHLSLCADEIRVWSTIDTLEDVLIQDRSMRIENLVLELKRERGILFEEITVLDRGENVVASTDLPSIGQRVPLDSLPLIEPPYGALRFGDFPNIDTVPNEGLVMVHPIISRLSTEPIGWIVARASWEPVERFVAISELDTGWQAERHYFLLVDDDNHILAGTSSFFEQVPEAATLLGRIDPEGVSTEELEDFGTYLVARYGSRAAHNPAVARLQIVALWKRSEAYAVVRSFMFAVVGSAVLGLLLAGGASFVIARTITRRMRRLTQGTNRLAEGDLDHRVEEGRNDEIGRLARSFNRMAGNLAKARNDLQASAARWQALVTNAPDIVMTTSLDGTIKFVNRTVPGLRVEDVIGASIYDFTPEKYHPIQRRALEEAGHTGEPRSLELESVGAHGSSAWYSVRIGPIKQDDQVAAFTMIVTDITERKRLERDILEVSELERERIGQDLHDGLGQALTGIALLSKGLQHKLSTRPTGDVVDAKHIEDLINQAIEQTRGLARGLMPIGLESHGLQAALEELSSSVDNIYGVSCHFQGPSIDLERSDARHLFRIAQEAVNNAIRHGKSTEIRILLEDEPNGRRLAIEDNGVGLPETVDPGNGMGLRLMNYRASMIGGSLEIRRKANGGTVVDCRF